MMGGHRRAVPFVASGVVLTLVAATVWFVADGSDGPGHGGDRPAGHQAAGEIDELSEELPEQLTPLDPDVPNPTGDDPLAIGAPPEIEPPSSPEDFLAQAEQRRAAAAAGEDQSPKARAGEPDPGPEPDPGSVLATFPEGTSDQAIADALAEAGVSGRRVGATDVAVVDTTGQDQATVTAALDQVEAVESVEPNLVRRATRNPNDPELAAQQPWLDAIHAPAGWDVADTGANAVVAVLDTGVDLDHPDLVPNLVPGVDVVNGDTTPADDNGHGTMVAGIVGAATDNGIGVAGVAWNAKIMPVKVLDADARGTDVEIAQGIHWAVDHGADVINMSLAGPGTSSLVDEAVSYALDHEVVLVAAAGNAASTALWYPAGAPGVLGVTATDAAGEFAWFSNHGPWYYLAAPGIGIRTTALTDGPGAAYTADTGTSFASPMVAGTAALLQERHPSWGWFEIADEMLRTARDAGPAGVDDAYGFGIIDASAALGTSPLGPTTQPNLAGDAGNLQSAPRAIATGPAASESIAYPYDEDWFAFDVPAGAGAGATITVTPPPAQPYGARAAEMDPVVELYGPGGGLVARVDETFEGEPEELRVNVAAGRSTLRVRNYGGSKSPAPYTVTVALGAPLPATAWAPPRLEFANDGGSAEAVSVADFNGDGRDDLALYTGFDHYTPQENERQLLVFLQEPTGTLGPPTRFPTHARTGDTSGFAHSVTTGDFDGDGDVDIAVGIEYGLDVAWNDGGGGFTAPTLFPIDGPVEWAVAANLDDTAAAELVVDYYDGTALRVVHWTGDDFTADPTSIPSLARSPNGTGFAVAELTGDDGLDIAVIAEGGVAIYAQDGDGTWTLARTVTMPDVGPDANSLAASDINSDDRADLVVATGGNRPSSRLVYAHQMPDGGFEPAVTLDSYDIPGPIEIGDVDADGRSDVVVLHDAWQEAGVYRQTPTGRLADEELLPTLPYSSYKPDGLGIGDFDADGVNDLAIASYNQGLVLVEHQGPDQPEGAPPWVTHVTPGPHATNVATSARPSFTWGRDVAAASVNQDTVFLVDGRDGRTVPTSLSLGGGTTTRGSTVTLTPSAPLRPGVPYQVWISGVTDLDGTDAAFERFTFTTAAAPPTIRSVSGTYLPVRLDLDGNGYDDVFWYGTGTTSDSVWLMGPNGHTAVAFDVGGTLTPIAGDFDGNGYDDIFWYAPGSGTDTMWWNGRNGMEAETIPVGGVYVPAAGDFDRNGYDDIVWYASGTAADHVWYFRADRARTSVAQVVNGSSYRVATGDFTRDGYDDVLWHAPGTTTDHLWRGQPSGFLAGATIAINGDYQLRNLDHNGDGFEEVFLYRDGLSKLLRSGTTGFTGTQAAPTIPSASRPVTGDFTGDLRDDLLAYVPGTGADRLYQGTPTGLS